MKTIILENNIIGTATSTAKVKNKNVLKEIARRYAKSLLINAIHDSFGEMGLSNEEIIYIGEQIEIIGMRITPLPPCTSTGELVSEYYDYDE